MKKRSTSREIIGFVYYIDVFTEYRPKNQLSDQFKDIPLKIIK